MKHCTLIALVCLPLLPFLFFSNDAAPLLSWCILLVSAGCLCFTKNKGTCTTSGSNCPTAASSTVVKLSAFNFCFALTLIGYPLPPLNLLDPPMWFPKSGYIAKLASMCHSKVFTSFLWSKVTMPFYVLCNHFMCLTNWCQSLSIGFCVLAQNTAVTGWMFTYLVHLWSGSVPQLSGTIPLVPFHDTHLYPCQTYHVPMASNLSCLVIFELNWEFFWNFLLPHLWCSHEFPILECTFYI